MGTLMQHKQLLDAITPCQHTKNMFPHVSDMLLESLVQVSLGWKPKTGAWKGAHRIVGRLKGTGKDSWLLQ